MSPRKTIHSLFLGFLLSLTSTANAESCQNSIVCVLYSDNPFEVTAGTLLMTVTGLFLSIPATSDSTSETFNYYFKKSAQHDAAAFIASNGEIRGAFFESALKTFNTQRPDSNLKDMDVALWLLSANLLL